MYPGRATAAGNIDLISSRLDEPWRDLGAVVDITHRDRAAHGVAIGTGGRVADGCAIAINQLTAPEDRFRLFQHEDRQPPPDTGLLLFQQTVAADEILVPI